MAGRMLIKTKELRMVAREVVRSFMIMHERQVVDKLMTTWRRESHLRFSPPEKRETILWQQLARKQQSGSCQAIQLSSIEGILLFFEMLKMQSRCPPPSQPQYGLKQKALWSRQVIKNRINEIKTIVQQSNLLSRKIVLKNSRISFFPSFDLPFLRSMKVTGTSEIFILFFSQRQTVSSWNAQPLLLILSN